MWRPQSIIEEYKPIRYNKEKISPSVNESASGVLNVLTFGDRSFMTGVFRYITDKPQSNKSPIDSNPTGRQDAVDFMEVAIKKHVMEFMENRDDVNTFNKVLLERTSQNSKGVGYELEKDFDEYIIGYYTLGELSFREVT